MAYKNPYSKYPLTGRPHTIAEVARKNVYFLGKGGELEGICVRAEVHDMEAKDDKGQPIPPTVVMPCPRCNKGLRIDGYKKGVTVQYYSRPRHITVPGFGPVVQACVISVHEVMTCPHDRGADTFSSCVCGLRFKIQENYISRV